MIALGIDMFDCVMPTRNARNGLLFTTEGIIKIRNEKWKNDLNSIDNGLENEISHFYLSHLIIIKEIIGAQIASIHNLAFYLRLVNSGRQQIIDGTFDQWKKGRVKKVRRR